MTPTDGAPARGTGSAVDFDALFRAIPTPYLVMDPDLVIVDANPAYLANVGRTLEELLGEPVFEAFPPQPDALDEDGVPHVQLSFERARDTGQVDTMPLQKYAIPDGHGGMSERYWSLISVPVLGPDGRTALVVQRAEDITDFVRAQEATKDQLGRDGRWEHRVQEVEADLYARAQELAAALDAKELAGKRLMSLSEVALKLAGAESVRDLAVTVFGAGLPVLGASGASVAVLRDGELAVTATPSLNCLEGLGHHEVGQSGLLVPDAEASDAPVALQTAAQRTQMRAWAVLPLRAGRELGSLVVGWEQPRTFPVEEVELLRAFAAQCAQALDRLEVREAERAAAEEVARISETLQRSLLTPPPPHPRLEFAVSYEPASQVAKVGGDWYDAFTVRGKSTSLVIGDVAGHDQDAAAAMAQVRNILRGVAQSVVEPPAAVLGALDAALQELGIGLLATLVLAQVTMGSDGTATLRWCNAGHPPPVLVRSAGPVELLTRPSDLLLGLLAHAGRADHEVVLEPGDTVLLYTDGLVENRGSDIERDLADLVDRCTGHEPGHGPQALLERVAVGAEERSDDVAMLAVRLLPEQGTVGWASVESEPSGGRDGTDTY